MNLLEKIRRRNTDSSLLYYQSIINREQRITTKKEKLKDDVKVSRSFDIKEIDENKKILTEKLIKSRQELQKKMEMAKEPNISKNKRILEFSTLNTLMSGFLDSKNKKGFIKKNSENFKNLEMDEQKILFKLFMDYI